MCSMIQQQSSFSSAIRNNANYPPFALVEGSMAHSNAIVEPGRLNGTCWRMEVRPGDASVPYGSYRAEMTITSKGTVNTYKQNALRFSSKIPSGTWATRSQEEIFPFQFHPWSSTNNGGSPSLAIEIQNDTFQAVVRHTQSGSEQKLTYKKGPVERDVWVDWVVYYQPHVSAGRVIIWRRVVGVDADYKIWFEYSGPCLHSWSQYPFLKTGIYWWNRPSTGASNLARVGYIDELAFGISTPETIVSEFRIDDAVIPPPPNNPPLVNAGPDQALLEGATMTQLDGEATDANGDKLTPLWELLSSPAPAVFNSTDWNPVITGMVPGEYEFKLTVTDSKGATGSDTVKVIIPKPVEPEKKELYKFADFEQNTLIILYDDGTWIKS